MPRLPGALAGTIVRSQPACAALPLRNDDRSRASSGGPRMAGWIWFETTRRERLAAVAASPDPRSTVLGELLAALEWMEKYGAHPDEEEPDGRIRILRVSTWPDSAIYIFFTVINDGRLVVLHVVQSGSDRRDLPESIWKVVRQRYVCAIRKYPSGVED
jgi:hypothetical protein